MITQHPILPNHNFTYRLNATGQEGTLWWHAHVAGLRATLHGAFIIQPRHGASSYPFPKPHKEIPIIIGDWWQMDVALLEKHFKHEIVDDLPVAATINGKLGDHYNSCSGAVEDGFVLEVKPGETYLLRIINAVLFSEYYFKIAGHKFTVVGADANYVNPYTTDLIAIAPGETVDALVVADAPQGTYYMVALPNQSPLPDPQIPVFTTRGMIRYKQDDLDHGIGEQEALMPEMPDQHDTMTGFYFRGNLTGLRHPRQPHVPLQVDEDMFITLGLGSFCPHGKSCGDNWKGKSVGVWFMHCHYEFHLMMGMAAVFIVEDGPTALPRPPDNSHPNCSHANSAKTNELYLRDDKGMFAA
ncbi:hypothetical protein HU200_049038 [Digitaria exilis]|uniref:laccase n=1 Tax=Digitaria exilis TaxID=1010633 RepID=A0A835EA70_9POAL|nr:hypothetical protein HU200_049038 [Digitaria exilis]